MTSPDPSISDYGSWTQAWTTRWSALCSPTAATAGNSDEKSAQPTWIHLPRVRTRRAFIQVLVGCTLLVGAAFYLVSEPGRIEGWRVGGGTSVSFAS